MERQNYTPLIVSIILFIALIVGIMFTYPIYKVWSSHKHGEAEYARAEQNRRIKILEAEAKKESAKLEAEAEVFRAEGVKKSNDIVQAGLGGPEGYLRYLYIQSLSEVEHAGGRIIYVPTEAGLPILEAGQR